MGDLSKNLSRFELACKCGCGFDTADIETVKVVQSVCDHFSCIVKITSGCRCKDHNAKVGGSSRSQHIFGRAADCVFGGVEPSKVDEFLNERYPDKYGFGVYRSFNHIDTRSGRMARFRGQ